jgi:hypothetical protein
MTEREAWNRCGYLEGDPGAVITKAISSAPITRSVRSPSGFATPCFLLRDDPATRWLRLWAIYVDGERERVTESEVR